MKIIYPYPMKMSHGYTYMLSITQFLISLAKYLPVELLSLDTKEEFDQYIRNQFNIKETKLKQTQINNAKLGIKSNKLFFKYGVYSVISKYKEPVIVYSRDLKQLRGLISWRKKNIRFIYEAHQILSQNYCRQGKYKSALKHRRLEESVLSNVNALVCITSTLSDEIDHVFSKAVKKKLVLPVGFPERLLDSQNDTPKRYDIVYSGNYSPWKGVNTLIEAIAILKEKYRLRCVFIGVHDDMRNDLLTQVKQNNVSEFIEIHGRKNHQLVCETIAASCIGVLPTNLQGDGLLYTSPLKLYEYLATGMPVVATRIPPVQQAFPEHLLHWSLPGDAASMVKAIEEALSDRNQNLRKERQAYVADFTWDKRAQKFSDFCQNHMSFAV